VFDEYVVELADEKPGQLLFVGFLGDDGLPRLAESVDETGEGQYQGFPKQPGLRSEVTKQKVFADSGGLGDFARRGAAVVAAREQRASGVEQKSPRLAAGPADRRLCGRPLLG
jgi:hypothetical protein